MKFNALIPELSVSDIRKSKMFYLDVIGFNLEYERLNDKFAFISFGDAQIMIEQVNGCWQTDTLEQPFGRGINFQIKTDDIASLQKRIISFGYNLFVDVEENHYRENSTVHKNKELLVQDPDGYLLRFSQALLD